MPKADFKWLITYVNGGTELVEANDLSELFSIYGGYLDMKQGEILSIARVPKCMTMDLVSYYTVK